MVSMVKLFHLQIKIEIYPKFIYVYKRKLNIGN
nr:MAG TPA: hypothetical protein [Caudoviricetes sp.]